MNTDKKKRASGSRERLSPSRQRGVVIVITLLALVLLAGLVFYVFNLGRGVQARVVTQQAADAAAIAGAGSVARALNTVAMNNVEISRLIAEVNVLDAMPQAVAFTLKDQQTLLEALEAQRQRGAHDWWVREALQQVEDQVRLGITELEPMDNLFNRSGFDVRRLTYYDGPAGRGELWKAMAALDAASVAAMDTLPTLAQTAAVRAAEANLADSESAAGVAPGSAGLLLPVLPQIAWQRGQFDDFRDAVTQGLPPHARATAHTQDWHHYRGPYDAVFGWRILDTARRRWVDGGHSGSVPIGSRSQGRWVGHTPRPRSYSTFGPQAWSISQLGHFRRNSLPYSRFAYTSQLNNARSLGDTNYWVNRLAEIKLGYLWHNLGPTTVIDPQWEIRFDQAAAIADTQRSRIAHTRFVIVEIMSRHPRHSPRFGEPGSWVHVSDSNQTSPRVHYSRGWVDPRDWHVPRVERHIWRDEWSYTATSEPSIGLPPIFDPDGTMRSQRVYRIDSFMFAGVDLGDSVPVRNPHNFTSREDLPAPIDLDHDAMRPDTATRQHQLTFLGIARQSAGAAFWSRRFDAGQPDPSRTAIAQARVFNNHSWDLWTQMWHAQLEPVADYAGWLSVLDSAADDAAGVPALAPQAISQIERDLRAAEALAPVMLTH